MMFHSRRYPIDTRYAKRPVQTRRSVVRTRLMVATLPIFILGLVLSSMQPAGAAIAFRAASTGTTGGAATSLSIATPTGTIAGDVMIAIISVRGGTGTTIAAPGWTAIKSLLNW